MIGWCFCCSRRSDSSRLREFCVFGANHLIIICAHRIFLRSDIGTKGYRQQCHQCKIPSEQETPDHDYVLTFNHESDCTARGKTNQEQRNAVRGMGLQCIYKVANKAVSLDLGQNRRVGNGARIGLAFARLLSAKYFRTIGRCSVFRGLGVRQVQVLEKDMPA